MELTGRLTADARIISTKNDNKLVKFSVATNDRYKTKDGGTKDIATYFNCSYWISTGIAGYLLKGGLVELSGRVSASAYKDKDGEPKASIDFHVDRIKLHGGTKPSLPGKAETHTEPAPTAAPEEDLPF
jgi:single-strand DNA-binding protein